MRLLLGEEQQICRKGIREILEGAGHVVIGEAADGQEVVRLARTLSPDIVVLGIALPHLNGVDAAREIRRMSPEIRIIILTRCADKEQVLQAMKFGVNAYVLKSDSIEELLHAIDRVHCGETHLSSGVAGSIVEAYLDGSQLPPDPLTPRERQVLQLVAEGNTTKAVAQELNISIKTVETHRSHLMQKLDLHNVAALVRYAMQRGLIHM